MIRTDDRIRIEGVKLAIDSLPRSGIFPAEIVSWSIRSLLKNYGISNKEEFLEAAFIQVIAWLELGLEYGVLEKDFDQVLEMMGVEKEEFLFAHVKESTRIKITRNRIRNLIGRWRTRDPNDWCLNDVVEDIYNRMLKAEDCFCSYSCHSADGSIFGLQELLVLKGKIMLHDVKQRKYYFFEREKDVKDKSDR